jgi:hypothetical protein
VVLRGPHRALVGQRVEPPPQAGRYRAGVNPTASCHGFGRTAWLRHGDTESQAGVRALGIPTLSRARFMRHRPSEPCPAFDVGVDRLEPVPGFASSSTRVREPCPVPSADNWGRWCGPCPSVPLAKLGRLRATCEGKKGATANNSGPTANVSHLDTLSFGQMTDPPLMGFPS